MEEGVMFIEVYRETEMTLMLPLHWYWVFLGCAVLLAGCCTVLAEQPAEQTPPTLPGAESFIYRDGAPAPMRLHVFKPDGWRNDDRRTAFIFFFGGGWTKNTPEQGNEFPRYFAQYGVVGIAPDYRTKNRFGTSPLEAVADARAVVRWVQNHAGELGVDPQRIVVGGHSSGGHVALWTAIDKTPPGSISEEAPHSKPRALVLLSPVADTSPGTGYTPERFGTNATALSPVAQLDGKMPTTLLMHGESDSVIPFRQSRELNAALLKNGAEVQFVPVPGGSHNFIWETPGWHAKTLEALTEFLNKQKLLNY